MKRSAIPAAISGSNTSAPNPIPRRPTVARTVVGHHPGDRDAEAVVVGQGCLQEDDGALFFLIRHDPGEGEARGGVDADMDEYPADAAAVALAGAVAGDAMADAVEASELLDVDEDHLAGVLALVAADRLDRVKRLQIVQPKPFEHPADGGRRDAGLVGDLLAGPALAAQDFDLLSGHLRGWPVEAMRPRGAIDQASGGELPLGIVVHPHGGADIVMAMALRRDLQGDSVPVDAVVATDLAVLLDAQDVLEQPAGIGQEGGALLGRGHGRPGSVSICRPCRRPSG